MHHIAHHTTIVVAFALFCVDALKKVCDEAIHFKSYQGQWQSIGSNFILSVRLDFDTQKMYRRKCLFPIKLLTIYTTLTVFLAL